MWYFAVLYLSDAYHITACDYLYDKCKICFDFYQGCLLYSMYIVHICGKINLSISRLQYMFCTVLEYYIVIVFLRRGSINGKGLFILCPFGTQTLELNSSVLPTQNEEKDHGIGNAIHSSACRKQAQYLKGDSKRLYRNTSLTERSSISMSP